MAIMASADALLSSSRSDNGSSGQFLVQGGVSDSCSDRLLVQRVVQTVVLTGSWYKGWFRQLF